jgi:hypothetical protein
VTRPSFVVVVGFADGDGLLEFCDSFESLGFAHFFVPVEAKWSC